MSLRSSELRQVVDELAAMLPGARVQKAFAPMPALCYLELRQPGRTVRLVASTQPKFARLSVAGSRFTSPGAEHPFQGWLRRELVGSTLTRLEALAELIVQLEFRRGDRVRKLIAELSGSEGRLVLLGERDRVLATSSEGKPVDRLRAGSSYAPPEMAGSTRESAPSRLSPATGAAAFPFAAAAELLISGKEKSQRVSEIRRRMQSPLKARLARVARTLQKVEAEASRQPEAEAHRRLGELISQNAHRIPRGARAARLVEYSDQGPAEVEVALQPERTPKQQAEWHFHQYRRLTRGCAHASRRLQQLRGEAVELEKAVQGLRQMTDEELLERRDLLASPRRKLPSKGRPYKEYFSAAGERIWVGRDSKSNDELTFRVARPDDLWLHTRGAPGSHVVVPLDKSAEPSAELLVDSAHLALHHSELKGEPRGEVAYTRAKYVKKKKGDIAGSVSVTREKTFTVRIEHERLDRLLRSRLSPPSAERPR